MKQTALERLCVDLQEEFDGVSPMYDATELVVYLPLDDNKNPSPPDIGRQVITYLDDEAGLDADTKAGGQVVVAEH